MRVSLLFLFLNLFTALAAQDFPIPPAKVLAKNKVKELRIRNTGNPYAGIAQTYFFNKKGRVIRRQWEYFRDDSLPSYYTYQYDRKGRVVETARRLSNGVLQERTVTTWYRNGLRVEKNYNYPLDSNRISYETWANRKQELIRLIQFDSASQVKMYEHRFTYDDNGLNYGGYDSVAETRIAKEYVYGEWQKIKYYDEKGVLQQIITLKYDSTGAVIAIHDSLPLKGTSSYYEMRDIDNWPRFYSNGKDATLEVENKYRRLDILKEFQYQHYPRYEEFRCSENYEELGPDKLILKLVIKRTQCDDSESESTYAYEYTY